jgi:hypothetical protein
MSLVDDVIGLVKLEKAKLVVPEDISVEGPRELKFKFNPKDYTIARSVTVEHPNTPTGGATTHHAEYRSTGAATLNTVFFFDAFEELAGDVSEDVNTILSWTQPTESSIRDERPSPPEVKFEWGANPFLRTFRGFLTSVSAQYTMFRKNGTPIQARVTVTITDVWNWAIPGQNPTSRSLNARKTYRLVDGDTLASVAFREWGRATWWRALATFNDIDDPLRVAAGTILLIPSAAEAQGLA